MFGRPFLLAFDPETIYLDACQRELLKWMESVNIGADRVFPISSRPPTATLPGQSFNKKHKHVKKESGSTEQLLNDVKGKQEVKAKKDKNRASVPQSSVGPTKLLQVLESVDGTLRNDHGTNGKHALKSDAYQSYMYSVVPNLQSLEPALFSGERNHFSQHLGEHLHPVLSYWFRLTETPPDGNCLWHTISLDLCCRTELMTIL